MTANMIRLIWISKTNLDPDREARLLSKFEGHNDLKIYTCDQTLPEGSAEATRVILEAAERYKVVVIAGEFEPNVAAQLVKSQTFGGRFCKYIIALPLRNQDWEIFL